MYVGFTSSLISVFESGKKVLYSCLGTKLLRYKLEIGALSTSVITGVKEVWVYASMQGSFYSISEMTVCKIAGGVVCRCSLALPTRQYVVG